ncbi:MAG: dienelactone hydrolase family protein [Pseudodesulfovibrio sp.]|uniref:Dienelactone hydrolase n=1 Tax=Pseudodesulfovibrio aespoeensis (strain ATCC 700646 / DSM 10631 / Aspo-2) TaxID=643562 RepID=E6VS19_PSEA9|nr:MULTISPECIES: dienelactone hydrolase family protein [Pseudodesulfovibrio]MBU4190861.1 dienelactone hydrolase family protein [Pseudomonadota bacterium]MCG2734611.1 dienelactone hydrolase family protein [Pseudodesulfovibrio aespoeensis]ADU61952.1 dienelactone hydrolase [Pseudodesulfovibrio aespoeensis Aspo-2]MBU4245361.1 dienelactone hydrolase family protein [Pseudomonadota bacterium]MBU4380312.1 dienelactone hydrolase family protein [Pseudomonadota bacterium]
MITYTTLPYRHGQTPLEGTLVHDDALTRSGPLPGVLVFHEFMGPGGYMLPHAEMLARHGFAALLCDMYGAGVRPRTPQEASAQSRIYRSDRRLMRQRALAGLQALAGHGLADPARLHAVGFSFGGCTALELARSGAPLLATASFYGYLNTPLPCSAGDVKGRILVLHGVHDRVVPMTEIPVFEQEMRGAGVDFRVITYPDAGHGFANATQPGDPATGSWHCAKTCRHAWAATLAYFNEST